VGERDADVEVQLQGAAEYVSVQPQLGRTVAAQQLDVARIEAVYRQSLDHGLLRAEARREMLLWERLGIAVGQLGLGEELIAQARMVIQTPLEARRLHEVDPDQWR